VDWLVTLAKEYSLFVALVAYVLYDSRQRENRYILREQKYIKIIGSIESIKKDLQDIKSGLFK
jgi:hypothetical protein